MKPTDDMYIFTLVQKMTCVKMTLLALTTAAFIFVKKTLSKTDGAAKRALHFFSNYHFLPQHMIDLKDPVGVPFFPF